MGQRSNIEIKFASQPSIYIYSHWGGGWGNQSDLRLRLYRALDRRQRWSDEQYLAAIIMREVLRGRLDEETGVGLAPYPGEEEYVTTTVDMSARTVDGRPFAEWLEDFNK